MSGFAAAHDEGRLVVGLTTGSACFMMLVGEIGWAGIVDEC
jgi:hypothetical protein